MGTHPIKYFLLNKNELSYEVLIRGEEPASTVLGLRKQINKIILLVPDDDIMDSGLPISDDCEGVIISIKELGTKVNNLHDKYDDNLFQRTMALHNHVYYRLKRLDKSDTSFVSQIKSLYKEFELISNKLMSLNKSVSYPSATTDQSASSSNDSSQTITVHCDHSNTAELKIKYDGKSCVHAFVQRMNEYKTVRNLPSKKLLMFAADIFTGNALHWYRSVRDSIKDWDELIAQLVEDFSPVDYDYRLMSEIRNRTQGDQESIIIYLAIMSELFSRLTKQLSEQDKLEILLHNIRPCYSAVLASCITGIESIALLRKLCLNYEKIQCLTSQFREPPKINNSTLAPDLAYVRTENKQQFYKSYDNYSKPYNNPTTHRHTNSYSSGAPVAAVESASIDAVNKHTFCPRCRSSDHSLRQCKKERYPICFKCGLKDFTFPNCPNCHPNSSTKN